jgi:predicted metal-dependent hydrolase
MNPTAPAEFRLLGLGAEESLPYTLRRTGRRKSIGIHVEPSGNLSILVPARTPIERVEQVLRRRLKWIRRKRHEVETLPHPMPPREWVAGETHLYLGRQYRLKLVQSQSERVSLIGGHFVVCVRDRADRETIRALMMMWYREHANSLFTDRVQRLLASTTWLDFLPPRIQVRMLRNRWGSTSRSGRVTFNIDLIKLSLSCIDYVVAHELVHLRIPNHSPSFWRMLERVMPDWRKWQRRLAAVET